MRFLRWCSECGCGKRRRLLSAEAVSARTRKDPELGTERGFTTHGMCMQSGLDAAGVPDQPMSSTMRIQLENDEGGVDRQAKHMVHEATGRQRGNDYTDTTRPAEQPDEHEGSSRERRRPPSLSC